MVSELSEDEYQETIAYCLNPCFSGGWSQSAAVAAEYKAKDGVLILVLVEDGLRGAKALFLSYSLKNVLILVLVEDGLRGLKNSKTKLGTVVLILVLVEDGLREASRCRSYRQNWCLNPCFSGGWSQSVTHVEGKEDRI